MATSSAGLLGKLPDLIAEQKTGEGRFFGEVLPLLDAGDPRLSGNSPGITFVVLAKAGTQSKRLKSLGSRLRGNDGFENRSAKFRNQLQPRRRRPQSGINGLRTDTSPHWEEYGAAEL
jgi:hypothetical protein